MNEHEPQQGPNQPSKMNIMQRLQRYGEHGSRAGEATLPQTANPGKNYLKIAEWYGPVCQEITTGKPLHYYLARNDLNASGSNLFEVYLEKSLGESAMNAAKQALTSVALDQASPYKWEPELKIHYPAVIPVVTDPEAFTPQP